MIPSINATARAARALTILADESLGAAKVADLEEHPMLATEYRNQAHDYCQVAQMLQEQLTARTITKPKGKKKA